MRCASRQERVPEMHSQYSLTALYRRIALVSIEYPAHQTSQRAQSGVFRVSLSKDVCQLDASALSQYMLTNGVPNTNRFDVHVSIGKSALDQQS